MVTDIAELQIKRQIPNSLLDEVKYGRRMVHKDRTVLKKLNQNHIQQGKILGL